MSQTPLSSTTTYSPSPKSIYGDRYVVHAHIGTGRYGKVFHCSDTQEEHKDIVLKVPYRTTSKSLARHRREAKVMRLLDGLFIEHIARYRDFTHDDALVMDRIEGFSLSSISDNVRNPAISPRDIILRASYLLGPAACLEAIAEHELIHRDIKPENILVRKCRGYLIDWNLAGKIQPKAAPRLIGTPDYMAPELLGQRAPASAASDVYSLAATLYSAVFCKPPRGTIPHNLSRTEVIKRLLSARTPEPHKINPKFPHNLSILLMSALSEHPSFRPEPEEFVADLEKCVEQAR